MFSISLTEFEIGFVKMGKKTTHRLFKRTKFRKTIFTKLKGLSHEIDFKNFDKKLHNLA